MSGGISGYRNQNVNTGKVNNSSTTKKSGGASSAAGTGAASSTQMYDVHKTSGGGAASVLDEATKQRGDNLFRKMEHAEYVVSMIRYAIENNIKIEGFTRGMLSTALGGAELDYAKAQTEFKNFKQKNPAYEEPSERMLTDFNFYADSMSESEINSIIQKTVAQYYKG